MSLAQKIALSSIAVFITCVAAFGAVRQSHPLAGKWVRSHTMTSGDKVEVKITVTPNGKVTAVAKAWKQGSSRPLLSTFKGTVDANGRITGTGKRHTDFQYMPYSMTSLPAGSPERLLPPASNHIYLEQHVYLSRERFSQGGESFSYYGVLFVREQ